MTDANERPMNLKRPEEEAAKKLSDGCKGTRKEDREIYFACFVAELPLSFLFLRLFSAATVCMYGLPKISQMLRSTICLRNLQATRSGQSPGNSEGKDNEKVGDNLKQVKTET